MKKTAVVLASLLIAACASSPKSVSQENDKITPAVEKPAATPETKILVNSEDLESKKLAAELQDLQKQSVYFDMDKFNIKPEFDEVIRKQAQFIKDHKNDIVTIEGNADERGSSEYNLALGEKRANAARKNLELLGVPDVQIKIVSLGENKPRLTCHEEKCWVENRRDDFVHKLN